MYIPIFINMKTREFYHLYPNAPEATRKAQRSSFQLRTSWGLFLIFFSSLCMIITSVSGGIFGKGTALISFLCLESAGIAIFYPIRKRAWQDLNEEARIEADMNRYVSAEIVQAKFDELKKELEMKSTRELGIILVFIGLFFILPLIWSIPFNVTDISTLSGSSLENGTYYIENILVLDLYAKAEKKEDAYYIALFKDKDDKLWFISFNPSLNTKARKMTDEYMNDESALSGLKLSVYARLNTLSQEGKNYTSLYTSSLSDYYDSSCRKYSQLINAGNTNMNANCICMGDENVIMSYCWSFSFLFIIVFGLALTGGGLFLFIKFRT